MLVVAREKLHWQRERERERESEKKTIGGHGKDEKKKEENLPSSFRLLYLKRERNEKVQKT